jgi:hypothetical protein
MPAAIFWASSGESNGGPLGPWVWCVVWAFAVVADEIPIAATTRRIPPKTSRKLMNTRGSKKADRETFFLFIGV